MIVLAAIINGSFQPISSMSEIALETTGVDDLFDEDKQLHYNGHTLTADGRTIVVYNAQGAKVLSGTDSVGTNALPRGIYVARAGDETLKFTVK